jgi:hypothetical protein
MNFHEKAHFVKGRRGGLGVAERNGFLCPSRYASIRTLGEPALFGGSVHYGIRLFGLPIEGAAIFASISPQRVDQVRLAQSPCARSEAIGQMKPYASLSRTALSGSSPPLLPLRFR